MPKPFISAYAEAGLGGQASELLRDRNGNLIGFLGSRGRGHFAETGAGASLPTPPAGFVFLVGADGSFLVGADGAFLLGAA